jgi:hypothetical protein
MKLRLYSDKTYIPDGAPHAEILYPFWGSCEEKAFWKEDMRFERYVETGHHYFEMVHSPESSDFIVLPADWKHYVQSDQVFLAKRFAESMAHTDKKIIVLVREDIDDPIPLANSLVFRSSLYASRRRQNEHALVAYTGDFVNTLLGGKLPIRNKQRRPTVSFCGQAFLLWQGASTREIYQDIIRKGKRSLISLLSIGGAYPKPRDQFKAIRTKALRYLRRCPELETSFIIRRGWYGGRKLRGEVPDQKRVRKLRLEFIDNMVDSDYVLCVRGAGNYSFRLYEALSVGRIPILVNTDCVLPYDFAIDWKKYCIWVESTDLRSIADQVVGFHSRISDDEYVALQKECRQVYKEWLTPEGFFRNLHFHFETAG